MSWMHWAIVIGKVFLRFTKRLSLPLQNQYQKPNWPKRLLMNWPKTRASSKRLKHKRIMKPQKPKELKAKNDHNCRGCFFLYENLLSNNAWAKWSKIVSSQTKAAPWTYLNNRTHKMAREKMMQAFEDCVTFHLLTIFPKDAEEQQRYCINMPLTA